MANYKKALLILPVVTLILLILVAVVTTVVAFSAVYLEYGGMLNTVLTFSFFASILCNLIFLLFTVSQGAYFYCFRKSKLSNFKFTEKIVFVVLLTIASVVLTYGSSQLLNYLFGFSQMNSDPAIVKRIPG